MAGAGREGLTRVRRVRDLTHPDRSAVLEEVRGVDPAEVREDLRQNRAALDRLGRDAIDVLQTVRQLGERGICVVVLQLGNTDLTAPAGKLLLSMLAAVAEMERDLLVERTQAGLARAKTEGKTLGRPSKTTPGERSEIRCRLDAGESVSALARAYGVSRANIIGIREHHAGS